MTYKNNYFLFPTVISVFDLNNSEIDFGNIINKIDEESKSHNGLIKNGVRSQQSKFLDLLPELKNSLNNCVLQYTEELGLLDCAISYSWCNIYQKNGNIKPHRHELSVISGAFYPFADGYAGQIVFNNPCGVFKINEVTKHFTEYNRQEFEIDVFPGLLVLFPSWLTHYSENNQAENRYVISFDTTLKEYI